MSDIRDDRQTALGSSYSIERELGGGGMSRVYIASETALGRRVVVKVLSPELAGAEELAPIDRRTTDEERLRYDVPPLATLLKQFPEQQRACR